MRSGYVPPENITDSDIVCPSCFDDIKKTQTKGITYRKKVNVGYQIGILLLGIIIPFVWLYPFHKVRKLGHGLIISILLTVAMFIPIFIPDSFGLDDTVSGMVMGVMYFAKIPILFYFLIKWTREWNKDAI